eukprot:TRINITY_DN34635_c0_g1_i1.p1 TRINITY_DN34635_c0_g1~~TRINITY_DN34635_c0_g1_i1.p1  ORF type:complete len:533 (-),score=85.36 TRINITY_DN34635_c0_g1_i1:60-1658(-)
MAPQTSEHERMVGHGVVPAMQPHEIEHIRQVYDEDAVGRKFCAVNSPREDAMMLRSAEKHAVPCECVIELYELLWRWGHRNTEHRGFAASFGFAIPDTIVIMKGKVYAWYFISKRDGALLRKTETSLSVGIVEKSFCRESDTAETQYCATWMPMASQFPEARCHSPFAEFLTHMGCRAFLGSLRPNHSGILQSFVEPHGVSNFLVRTVQFRGQTSLNVRTNRSLLAKAAAASQHLFDRAATFEGWPGLSSTCSRYRCHKHTHMEDLILAAGETLNRRIEQERVRQMLFLGPTQHVALHFKVTKEHMLFFIYASVVSEKEVILQTRPQLLMGDPCMTEALPGAALLPGGTEIKAPPFKAPACMWRGRSSKAAAAAAAAAALPNRTIHSEENIDYADFDFGVPEVAGLPPLRAGSLPPLRSMPSAGSGGTPPRSSRTPRRPLTERSVPASVPTVLPKMGCPRPEIPEAPYKIHPLPHSLQESGRYEYTPPFFGSGGTVKQPLVSSVRPPRPISRSPPGLSGARDFAEAAEDALP